MFSPSPSTVPLPPTPHTLLVVNSTRSLPTLYAIPETESALLSKLLPLDKQDINPYAVGGTPQEQEIRRLLAAQSEDNRDEEFADDPQYEDHTRGAGAGVLRQFEVGSGETQVFLWWSRG